MSSLDTFLNKDLLNPGTLPGAVFYGLLFLLLATLMVRLGVAKASKCDHEQVIDRIAAAFLVQLVQIGVYLLAFILYAHLIPELCALGTAPLASVSVASAIVGLAAQNALGNPIAGIPLLLHRPFRVRRRYEVTQWRLGLVRAKMTRGSAAHPIDRPTHRRIIRSSSNLEITNQPEPYLVLHYCQLFVLGPSLTST